MLNRPLTSIYCNFSCNLQKSKPERCSCIIILRPLFISFSNGCAEGFARMCASVCPLWLGCCTVLFLRAEQKLEEVRKRSFSWRRPAALITCLSFLLLSEVTHTRSFSTAVIPLPLTLFLLFLRNPIMASSESPHPPLSFFLDPGIGSPPPHQWIWKRGKKESLISPVSTLCWGVGWRRSGLEEKGNKKATWPRLAERDCRSRGPLYIIRSIAQ